MAAVAIQRNARSEEALLHAFREQTGKMGLRAAIYTLASDTRDVCLALSPMPVSASVQTASPGDVQNANRFVPVENTRAIRQVLESAQPLFETGDLDEYVRCWPEAQSRQEAGAGLPAPAFPVIYAPLFKGDDCIGVISLAGEQICEANIPAVETFAQLVSVAFEYTASPASLPVEKPPLRAGLLPGSGDIGGNVEREALERALHSRAQELEVLHQLSLDITSAQEETELLQKIVERAVYLLDAHGGSLYLCDPERRTLSLAVEVESIAGEYIGMQFSYGQGAVGRVAVTGEPLIIDDYRSWPGKADIYNPDQPYNAVLTVPMVWQGQVKGVLQVVDEAEKRRFDLSDQELLSLFANQAAVAYENARLLESERRRVGEADTLRQAFAALTSSLELEEVLESILDQLEQVVPYDSATIFLFENDLTRVMALKGFSNPEKLKRLQFPLEEDELGSIIRETHEPLILKDAFEDPRFKVWGDSAKVRAWLGVPLIFRGDVIGLLTLDNYAPDVFDASQAKLAQTFASQAAIAIENARLFEAERKARENAEAIRDAARIIGSSLSVDEVLKQVLQQLSNVITFESGCVMMVQGGRVQVRVGYGYGDYGDASLLEQIGFDIDGENEAGRVIREKRSIAIDDVAQQDTWRETRLGQHVRAWVGIPLISRGEAIGLFSLDRTRPVGFSADEVALAQTFANHTAIAIENARLFEAEGKRAAELEALRLASLSLTASLELPEVLDTILRSTIGFLTDVDNAHVFLYDRQKDRLSFGAALLGDGRQGVMFAEPRQDGLTYSVARSGDKILVEDMNSHPLFEGTPLDWNGAIVGLPLKIGDRVVGVMNVSYTRPRNFRVEELWILQMLADQAAIAVENARLYEAAARERSHLRLLYDVGRSLASSLEPDDLMQSALQLICQALDGHIGYAYLIEDGRLYVSATYGRPDSHKQALNEALYSYPGFGFSTWVAGHKQAIYVPDVRRDDRWDQFPGVEDDVSSALCAPVLSDDRLLGVLSVLHRKENAFSEAHLEWLVVICQEVGLALVNASQYQQVQRRLAEMTLIQRLGQLFNRRLEVQDLLDEVVIQLSQRLNYPQIRLFLIDGDALILTASYGPRPELDKLSIHEGIVGRVARTGEVSFVPDVSLDPDYKNCVEDTVAELTVPVFRNEKVIGVINVETHVPGQLSAQDRDILTVLADQVSVALENAELYEQARSHAEELEHTVSQRTIELAELYRLSQEIGYMLSEDDLMKSLLEHLWVAVGADTAVGFLFSKSSVRTFGLSRRVVAPSGFEQVREIALEIIPEPGNQFEFGEVKVLEGGEAKAQIRSFGSFMAIPVSGSSEMLGLLLAASEREDAFREDQKRVLETFSHQAATAIERLKALQAAERERMEGLVEHLPMGVLLLDAEFHLRVANPAGLQMLEDVGAFSQSDPDKLTHLGSLEVSSLIGAMDDSGPHEIVINERPRRVYVVQARPIGAELDQWVLTLRNVTQERDYQARIQMQERLATVGQMAAGIAHDFNNIMAAILVYADLIIGDSGLPDLSRERLKIIQQQVQRASSLIRQILDFSRRGVMDQIALDLLPFMKELEKMLARVLPETIHIRLSYRDADYFVRADPTRLQQVFINLAVNARDAMPDGGLLEFSLEKIKVSGAEPAPLPDIPPGEWVCITVADSGLGIAPAVLPHIFEPFFTTKPVGQGTGLGLAQVYGIIKQHEGHIDVESRQGMGTQFRIFLSAHPVEAKLPGSGGLVDRVDGSGQTVLVVEDDPATLEALKALLEAFNYSVITARNGQEALHVFNQRARPLSLVVSDIVMPRMGGVALYRALRQEDPAVKFLFVTGHPLDDDSQALLEQGLVHWLQKPFSVRDFNQAVRAIIGT